MNFRLYEAKSVRQNIQAILGFAFPYAIFLIVVIVVI